MNTNLFITFAVSWFLLCLTPGPAVAMVLSQSLRYSFKDSLNGVAGLQLGSGILYLLFGLGMTGLLLNFPKVYDVIRLVGACYLVYIGARALLSAFNHSNHKIQANLPDRRGLFAQGVITQLCNPKTVMFIFSLLPQFIDPHRALPPQLLWMLFATVLIDGAVLSFYSKGATTFSKELGSRTGKSILEALSGSIMVCLGLKLALARGK